VDRGKEMMRKEGKDLRACAPTLGVKPPTPHAPTVTHFQPLATIFTTAPLGPYKASFLLLLSFPHGRRPEFAVNGIGLAVTDENQLIHTGEIDGAAWNTDLDVEGRIDRGCGRGSPPTIKKW
jgi:hypothetical protein